MVCFTSLTSINNHMHSTLSTKTPNGPARQDAADPISELLISTDKNISSLQDQVKSIAGIVGDSKDALARLEKTVRDIVAAQEIINARFSKGDTRPDVKQIPDFTSLQQENYVPGRRYPQISKIINEYLRKPAFTHKDPSRVAENNSRPGWSLNTRFNGGYNHGLAMTLTVHLRNHEHSVGISTTDLGRIVKNHFCNQVREAHKSPEAASRKRLTSRRRQRTVVLLRRRSSAYQKYKELIDKEFGRPNCDNVLQKVAMSDDETDVEDHVKAYRPSWRSDELQRFLDLVDYFSHQSLKNKARQILKRTRHVKETKLPTDLAVPLPQWAIKK
ncbi:hypothetical protein CLU79DRAFT_749076 [Phycomyces nitens]|nr:hypothetical protein CLU79DRAFT_749076 [Phycomyces nitens]